MTTKYKRFGVGPMLFGVTLLLVLPGLLLVPKPALTETANAMATQRVTLLNTWPRGNRGDFKKSSVSFSPTRIYDPGRGPSTEWDLRYGGLRFNHDGDWFIVPSNQRYRSRIRDLGEMDWSDDIVVPVLPILPCPQNEPCGRIRFPSPQSGEKIQDEHMNPHVAKPAVGHMYLVHSYDGKRDLSNRAEFGTLRDYYTLVRVEELKPNESCTITWKRISSPKQ